MKVDWDSKIMELVGNIRSTEDRIERNQRKAESGKITDKQGTQLENDLEEIEMLRDELTYSENERCMELTEADERLAEQSKKW